MALISRQTSPDSMTQLRVIGELRAGLGGLLATFMLLLRSGALLRPWRIPAMLAFARMFDGMVQELCAVLERAVANPPAPRMRPHRETPARGEMARRGVTGESRSARGEALAPALPATRRRRVRAWSCKIKPVWAFAAPLMERVGWMWRRGPPGVHFTGPCAAASACVICSDYELIPRKRKTSCCGAAGAASPRQATCWSGREIRRR